MIKKRYLSYDNMGTMLNSLYRQMAIDGYKPDVVVGLVRGGLIPAVHVSHYFDVPLVAFKYSLRDHPGCDPFEKLMNLLGDHKRILIVDDICDEGHTLHEINTMLTEYITSKIENDQAKLDEENRLLAEKGSDYSVEQDFSGYDISFFKTAVLQHNLGATLFTPDYAGEEINKVEDPVWIVYPFEYE